MDLQRITEVITGIAQEAARVAVDHLGVIEGSLKYDGTLVTQCDSACERLIRSELRPRFPDHSIFGEEMGMEGPADNDWIWYLDPIDGTSNFIFGLPAWGVSIGLAHRGQPVAGVFHMPVTRQTWWAWQGGGAWCNGRPLSLHDPGKMNETDLIGLSSTILQRYDFSFPQKVRCYGSAAHALATMAGGSYAAVLHDHWHLHDIAAGLVMCREVGAMITTDDGAPFESFNGVDPCGKVPALLIAGPATHGQILKTIKRKV